MEQLKSPSISKERLDLLLYHRGLTESREKAKAIILSGSVLVDGKKISKAGVEVRVDANLRLLKPVSPYASRGGIKLEAALKAFKIDPSGCIAMDVGASTGGFTDCLLKHGVARVYAIDVGYGQLLWRLQQDARVIVLDRQNIRDLQGKMIPEEVDLATIDVSFISLDKVIPSVVSRMKMGGILIALVKPQFEVGKGRVGKGGIVKDATLREEVRDRISNNGKAWGLDFFGTILSPITGQKGNIEYFIEFRKVR
ncbi:MAG: TlyA family RNA methyltransferase [Nitrospiria bacterium]